MSRIFLGVSSLFLSCLLASSQQGLAPPSIPDKFTLDFETAARLRPGLMAQSIAATGAYSTGRLVFDRLLQQLPQSPSKPAHAAGPEEQLAWELRIVEDGQLNAYSSPDGTIYVETGLAQLAGRSTGLWAAILSHEIAHVIRRDWARRYLYQAALRNGGGVIVLGDPGLPSSSWTDEQKASGDLGRFCRQLEIEADRQGLMLMARAGYHPDFVPALHHLLHAQGLDSTPASLYAMHPCWEERDRELSRAYVEASIEFEHRWTAWYASPGGNPPVVVFAEAPTVRKTASREWEVQVPMRCQNLSGAVEVVLTPEPPLGKVPRPDGPPAQPDSELRQLTGCTSPRTTITFTLATSSDRRSNQRWADVYILDAWGAVLAHAEVPKLPR